MELLAHLLTGLALILVLEGLLYAVAPEFAKRIAAIALATASNELRVGGVVCLGIGVFLLYLLK